MAQHDYVIANQSGASFRADLNNGLAAIVSNNSGATAPSTTYAYMWWADTTTGQLKLRNAANDGWIVIQELDGTLLLEDGSAATPGLAFTSDVDTGLFRAGANQLGIATNGVERVEFGTTEVVFNDGGNDIDFRIEGDTNANLFFVDAGNDRVGIGNASPATTLDVDGDVTISDKIVHGGDTNTAIRFPAADTFAVETAGTERARITSSGQLLLGASSSSLSQQIESASTGGNNLGVIRYNDGSGGSEVVFAHSRSNSIGTNTVVSSGDRLGDILFKGGDGTNYIEAASISAQVDGAPGTNDMPGRLVFSTCSDGSASPSERLRITSTGQVRLAGAGITFNGDTAAANELDDYEEGTFTPFWSSSGATTPGDSDIITAYANQSGRYTKVGNRVFFSIWLKSATSFAYKNGGANGQFIYVGGLPFASANVDEYSSVTVGSYASWVWDGAGYGYNPSGYIQKNDNWIYIVYPSTNSAANITTQVIAVADSAILLNGHYTVA